MFCNRYKSKLLPSPNHPNQKSLVFLPLVQTPLTIFVCLCFAFGAFVFSLLQVNQTFLAALLFGRVSGLLSCFWLMTGSMATERARRVFCLVFPLTQTDNRKVITSLKKILNFIKQKKIFSNTKTGNLH